MQVQNLEYEHKEAKRQVHDTGENDLQKEYLGIRSKDATSSSSMNERLQLVGRLWMSQMTERCKEAFSRRDMHSEQLLQMNKDSPKPESALDSAPAHIQYHTISPSSKALVSTSFLLLLVRHLFLLASCYY